MIEVLDINEKEYRGLKQPSYSLLKQIDENGPSALKEKDFVGGESVDFGSLVDCLLLTPEELDNKFYFEAVEKPTGQILELADYIINNLFDRVDNYFKNNDMIEDLSRAMGLFGGVKDYNKRIAKFDNDLFWNYLQAKIDSEGKTVFTPKTLDDATEAIQILKTHEKTNAIFKINKNQETLNQLKLSIEINEELVKLMLDKVIIDHDTKTIQPYDLKCTDSRQKFFKFMFKKMKYYLQASLYRYGLLWWAEQFYPDYAVLDFKLIVYSRSEKYPFVWNVPDNWYTNGLYGFTDEMGQEHKGIFTLLKDYKFYKNNEDCKVDREFIINDILNI